MVRDAFLALSCSYYKTSVSGGDANANTLSVWYLSMVRNVFKIMTGALFIMDYDSLKLESHCRTMRKRIIENSTINHPAISKCVDTEFGVAPWKPIQ
jgi:hypothetical protein